MSNVHGIYCVFDVKSGMYGVPFFQPVEAVAKRLFSDLSNDVTTMVGTHPEDFSLYYIGDYEVTSAVITPVPRRLICTALELRAEMDRVRSVVREARDEQRSVNDGS